MIEGETNVYGIVKKIIFDTFPKYNVEISLLIPTIPKERIVICSTTNKKIGDKLPNFLNKEVSIKGFAFWDSELEIQHLFINDIFEWTATLEQTMLLIEEIAGNSYDNVDVDKYIQELRNE